MANKVIGAALNPAAVKQIHDRGNIIARNIKGPGSHLYGQSNTGWALLRSGVNTVNNSTSDQLRQKGDAGVAGSPDLARAAELTGGILNQGRARGGLARDVGSTTVRFNASDNSVQARNAAYTTSETQGIRPMPGITSVQINSANTYGTLLNARVSFLVHTLEELEVLELLYMKPGMYCLLEVGHSFFPESSESGTSPSNPYREANRQNSVVADNTWYNGTPVEIETAIHNLRGKNLHSYEGVFGPVTNFSWEYQNDGSYSCNIDITSKGIILEGLRVAPAAANVPDGETRQALEGQDESTAGFDASSATSGISHVITALLNVGVETTSGKAALENQQQADAVQKLTGDGDFKFPNFKAKVPENFGNSNRVGWISLGTLLNIINKYSTLYDQDSNEIVRYNTEEGQKFRTNPNHFSSDPLTILKAQAPGGDYSDFTVTKGDVHSTISGDTSDDIVNIYIGCWYILQVAQDIVQRRADNPESGIGVFDFLRTILDRAQAAFGNINKFEIIPDEKDSGLFYVVDRGGIDPDQLPTLNFTGLRTTVYNISVKSQIPSSLQSAIAIQAQAGPDPTAQVNDGMKVINRNIINRFYRTVTESTDGEPADVTQPNSSKAYATAKSYILDILTKYYENINAEAELDTALDVTTAVQAQQNAQIVQQFDDKQASVRSNNATMPIPVTLEIEMQGIGGIAPASAFRVAPGFLPRNYDDVAFIVTKLDHSLDTGNVWKTFITAQMFLPDA